MCFNFELRAPDPIGDDDHCAKRIIAEPYSWNGWLRAGSMPGQFLQVSGHLWRHIECFCIMYSNLTNLTILSYFIVSHTLGLP